MKARTSVAAVHHHSRRTRTDLDGTAVAAMTGGLARSEGLARTFTTRGFAQQHSINLWSYDGLQVWWSMVVCGGLW